MARRGFPRRAGEGGLAAALFVAAVVAGCAGSDPEPRSGQLAVEDGRVEAAYVAGDRLVEEGAAETLAAPVDARLLGTLAPAAVPAPDGEGLAYNAWRGRRPVVRLRSGGSDTEVAEGAHSVAWGERGIAYFAALSPDFEEAGRYSGHVVVRPAPAARPARWTSRPGRYVVAAWAGRSLLVYRLRAGRPDLLVLDGPGRERLLGMGMGLVAVSPDGERALLVEYTSSPPVVRLATVADGAEVGRARLEGLRWLLEGGSWAGEVAFAAADRGVAVLRVDGSSISLLQELRLDPARFVSGAMEPRADESGRRFATWAELQPMPRQAVSAVVLLECDRLERRCTETSPEEGAAPRLVYNPSRP